MMDELSIHISSKAWFSIKNRCRNPESKYYYKYGAVGVNISDELHDNFDLFCLALGEFPKDGNNYVVSRLDTNKGYEVGNIEWAHKTKVAARRKTSPNNSSGVSGVTWYVKDDTETYVRVCYMSEDGRRLFKSFSVTRYGLLPAFALAVQFRKDYLSTRLN